eukprot:8305471-Alexandrium_andersonii.AAC.1
MPCYSSISVQFLAPTRQAAPARPGQAPSGGRKPGTRCRCHSCPRRRRALRSWPWGPGKGVTRDRLCGTPAAPWPSTPGSQWGRDR